MGGQGAPVEPPANGHFTQRGEHLTWALRPSWDSWSRLVLLNAHSPNIIHRSSFRPVMSMEFEATGPNVVTSAEGELRIARVGLSVSFHGQQYDIDSEMLAPPMSIVVYFQRSLAAGADDSEPIRQFVLDALEFNGFNVESA